MFLSYYMLFGNREVVDIGMTFSDLAFPGIDPVVVDALRTESGYNVVREWVSEFMETECFSKALSLHQSFSESHKERRR